MRRFFQTLSIGLIFSMTVTAESSDSGQLRIDSEKDCMKNPSSCGFHSVKDTTSIKCANGKTVILSLSAHLSLGQTIYEAETSSGGRVVLSTETPNGGAYKGITDLVRNSCNDVSMDGSQIDQFMTSTVDRVLKEGKPACIASADSPLSRGMCNMLSNSSYRGRVLKASGLGLNRSAKRETSKLSIPYIPLPDINSGYITKQDIPAPPYKKDKRPSYLFMVCDLVAKNYQPNGSSNSVKNYSFRFYSNLYTYRDDKLSFIKTQNQRISKLEYQLVNHEGAYHFNNVHNGNNIQYAVSSGKAKLKCSEYAINPRNLIYVDQNTSNINATPEEYKDANKKSFNLFIEEDVKKVNKVFIKQKQVAKCGTCPELKVIGSFSFTIPQHLKGIYKDKYQGEFIQFAMFNMNIFLE